MSKICLLLLPGIFLVLRMFSVKYYERLLQIGRFTNRSNEIEIHRIGNNKNITGWGKYYFYNNSKKIHEID